MRDKVDSKSILQGFPQSRLPSFTPEEEVEIAGSADFIGVNHYTTNLVYPEIGDIGTPSFFEDDDVVNYRDDSMYASGSVWLKVAPFGMRKIVNWIKDNYGDWEIYITENGVSDRQGNLDDLHRIYFYKHYLNQMLKGVKKQLHSPCTKVHLSRFLQPFEKTVSMWLDTSLGRSWTTSNGEEDTRERDRQSIEGKRPFH